MRLNEVLDKSPKRFLLEVQHLLLNEHPELETKLGATEYEEEPCMYVWAGDMGHGSDHMMVYYEVDSPNTPGNVPTWRIINTRWNRFFEKQASLITPAELAKQAYDGFIQEMACQTDTGIYHTGDDALGTFLRNYLAPGRASIKDLSEVPLAAGQDEHDYGAEHDMLLLCKTKIPGTQQKYACLYIKER